MFFLSDGLRGALSQRLRFPLLSLLDCFGQRAVIPTSPPGRSRLSHLPLKRAYLPGGLRCPPSLIIDSCYIFIYLILFFLQCACVLLGIVGMNLTSGPDRLIFFFFKSAVMQINCSSGVRLTSKRATSYTFTTEETRNHKRVVTLLV